MPIFLRTLLMVSLLLMERVTKTRPAFLLIFVVMRLSFVSLTTLFFYISYALGTIASFLVGGWVNGQ